MVRLRLVRSSNEARTENLYGVCPTLPTISPKHHREKYRDGQYIEYKNLKVQMLLVSYHIFTA